MHFLDLREITELYLERTPSSELKVLKTAEVRTYGSKRRKLTLSNQSDEIVTLTADKTNSESSSNILKEMCSMLSSAETTPRKKKLKMKISNLKKTLIKKNTLNYRVKKKCKALSRKM